MESYLKDDGRVALGKIGTKNNQLGGNGFSEENLCTSGYRHRNIPTQSSRPRW